MTVLTFSVINRVCMIFLTESLLTVFCLISGAAIVCKILLFKRHWPDKMPQGNYHVFSVVKNEKFELIQGSRSQDQETQTGSQVILVNNMYISVFREYIIIKKVIIGMTMTPLCRHRVHSICFCNKFKCEQLFI